MRGEVGVGTTHNADGQFDGVPGASSTVPVQVSADVDWTDVAVGADHTCARKQSGELWCWGSNRFGQRGDGLAWRASFAPVIRP